jgi:hypothetical protein
MEMPCPLLMLQFHESEQCTPFTALVAALQHQQLQGSMLAASGICARL